MDFLATVGEGKEQDILTDLFYLLLLALCYYLLLNISSYLQYTQNHF